MDRHEVMEWVGWCGSGNGSGNGNGNGSVHVIN